MRYLSLVVVVSLFVFAFITNSFAQSSETESLKNKVDMLEKELQEIKDLLKQQIERDVQKEKEIASLREEVQKKEVRVVAEEIPAQPTVVRVAEGEQSAEEVHSLARPGAELEEKNLAPAFGGVYTKPFLRRFGRNTYLGGYMDFEYRTTENEADPQGFTQKRFIPFIYSDISDRVKLAAEIEFEFGGVGGGRNGEVITGICNHGFFVNRLDQLEGRISPYTPGKT